MKTTVLACVASLGLVLAMPGIASADVNTGNTDKKVTMPKGPMGKVTTDADKNPKMPTGKAAKVKLPNGKMALGANVPGKFAKLDCKNPKLDAKMKAMCDAQNANKRS
jgi:hypothetical protein